MSILKKTIAGALTIALSVGAIGTSAMPVLAASENNIDVLRKNVEKAQEAYDKAETDYDNGAIEFLESKMCEYHKNNFTVEKYEENIKIIPPERMLILFKSLWINEINSSQKKTDLLTSKKERSLNKAGSHSTFKTSGNMAGRIE